MAPQQGCRLGNAGQGRAAGLGSRGFCLSPPTLRSHPWVKETECGAVLLLSALQGLSCRPLKVVSKGKGRREGTGKVGPTFRASGSDDGPQTASPVTPPLCSLDPGTVP